MHDFRIFGVDGKGVDDEPVPIEDIAEGDEIPDDPSIDELT